ncbi:MAG: metallophosphoesterase [Candidatus Saccharibacteria bacterium]
MQIRINRNDIIILGLIISVIGLAIFFVVKYQPATSSTTNPVNLNTTSADSFTFDIQADPHMDENSDAATYKQTLANIVSDNPSFLIDLGDIFMVDKLSNKSATNITNRYTMMKSYYDLLGSTPLYFAMGNHDGEVGWDSLNTKSYRKTYFPNQTYDKNYYSFTQNSSLFVVLDPFTYTTTKPDYDSWNWTLGKQQYDWLSTTLKNSSAKYKFVFIHQLVGGDNQGRGGVEVAKYFEWGGKNLDGSDGFNAHRSDWGEPIHQLLVDNKVNAVFKGHDHLYAKQELDGIIYQTLPQPSHAGDKLTATYSYQSGTILGGSGHLRLTENSSGVRVEFVKANTTKDIVDLYTIQ